MNTEDKAIKFMDLGHLIQKYRIFWDIVFLLLLFPFILRGVTIYYEVRSFDIHYVLHRKGFLDSNPWCTGDRRAVSLLRQTNAIRLLSLVMYQKKHDSGRENRISPKKK